MTANDSQIGGNHYRTTIQHWDYVLANGIPYLEAQVIKYLTRWRKKGGVQDLLKARHFLDKCIEEAQKEEALNPHPVPVNPERVADWRGFAFEADKEDFTMYQCKKCGEHVKAPRLTDPLLSHGECAGKAYVQQ